MTKSVNITMIQMTSVSNLEQNLSLVDSALRDTDLSQTDIVVLPEMFALFGVSDQLALAEQEVLFEGPVGQRIRALAQEFSVWFVAGTVPVLLDGETKPRARSHLVSETGELVSFYDKIHLFDAEVGDRQGSYRESDSYSPGNQITVTDTPWGKLGLAVCYDLRFPELFRQLNDQGAEFIILPAAFTYKTGEAHWEILCRARAVENGYFLVGVNQCGEHDAKRSTWGHSMVVSPWGDFESLANTPAIKTVTLQLDRVESIRKQIPVNTNRRL